jgi:hypothetical protein
MLDPAPQSSTFLFLEAFSKLVTIHSFSQNDLLARTGSFSIYALLSRIVPEVRNHNLVSRDAILYLDLTCRAFNCLETAN